MSLLPVPRLEIAWAKTGPDKWVANYYLVKRGIDGGLELTVLGKTKRTGSSPLYADGTIEPPFREEAHIAYDMLELRLPGFVTYDGESTPIDPTHVGACRAYREHHTPVERIE